MAPRREPEQPPPCNADTDRGPCILPLGHDSPYHLPDGILRHPASVTLDPDLLGAWAADPLGAWAAEQLAGLPPMAQAAAVMREQYVTLTRAGFDSLQALYIVATMSVLHERLAADPDDDSPEDSPGHADH